jgi:hypothetical protein
MADKAFSRAQLILQTRKRRAEYFRKGLFDEHDWDLMLLLYLAAVEGKVVDRQSVLDEIGVRDVVLERWIRVLADEEIIDGPSAGQGRLQLSRKGQENMRRLLSAE